MFCDMKASVTAWAVGAGARREGAVGAAAAGDDPAGVARAAATATATTPGSRIDSMLRRGVMVTTTAFGLGAAATERTVNTDVSASTRAGGGAASECQNCRWWRRAGWRL